MERASTLSQVRSTPASLKRRSRNGQGTSRPRHYADGAVERRLVTRKRCHAESAPCVASLDAGDKTVAGFAVEDLGLAIEPAARAAARRSLDSAGLLLGEGHGVRENPLLIRALMQAFGLTSVALEWPEDRRSPRGAGRTRRSRAAAGDLVRRSWAQAAARAAAIWPRPSRRAISDRQPAQQGPQPKTRQCPGRAVRLQGPAALPGSTGQTSLVRPAVRPFGPCLHDLSLDGRVHRVLPPDSALAPLLGTEPASAVLIHD
jgi:hypothetical protein